MAIKTYINGSENGTITFKGDTEPCAVYVNGERQDNISYIPQEVKGEKSVVYKSEYKKNIRTLSIEGNTYQYQSESTVNKADPSYFSNSENYSSGGTAIYYISLPASLAEKEIAVSLNEKSSLTGIKIAVADDTSPLFASAYSAILNSDGTTATATGSSFKYLVITRTVITEDDYSLPSWWDSYDLQIELGYEVTQYVPFVAETPSPEKPSAVRSSNDNGTSIALQGKNLLDGNLRTTPKAQNGITIQYLPDEDCYLFDGTCTANTSHYLITHNLFVNGRITASMVVISGTCEGSAQFSISYRDNLSETTFPLWVTKNIVNGNLSINQGVHKYIGATWFYIAKGTSFNNYKIKIQIELGTVVTEYEPYFNKTVEIPSSVTLPDGASLEMRFAKVGDKADKLSVKGSRAIYSQSTEKITLTGEESGWSEAEGVYKYSLGKALIENSGYCTHFKLSKTGDENTFGVESDGITFKTDVATGLENFKAWLKAKSDAGDAVQVTVALASPAEYDITDTEAGQNILALCAYTKNLTNIIKVTPNDTANPDVSSISVSYAKWGANLN